MPSRVAAPLTGNEPRSAWESQSDVTRFGIWNNREKPARYYAGGSPLFGGKHERSNSRFEVAEAYAADDLVLGRNGRSHRSPPERTEPSAVEPEHGS